MNPSSSVTPLAPSTEQNAPSTSSHPKTAQAADYPFQVVCRLCQKTISYSGENGEIFPVVCDQCTGIE